MAVVPLRVSVPAPSLVKCEAAAVDGVKLPPKVSVLLETVTVRAPFVVTAPVPRFRLLVPAKAKLPLRASALLVASVTELPLVLSMVPPVMVNVPVPMAEFVEDVPEALMFRVPAESVVPPE